MTPPDKPACPDTLTVLYDGACPLCRREVAFYQGRERPGEVVWVDVARAEATPLPAGLTREQALARFHAVLPDGRAVSGARAFLALWQRIPALRPLAWVLGLPPLPWLLEAGYRLFLRLRPGLQRLAPP